MCEAQIPGVESIFEERSAPTNVDYLKLAKANLETFINLGNVLKPHEFALEIGTLAAQIALVDALVAGNVEADRLQKEHLSMLAEDLRCVHNVPSNGECSDCQDSPPPEEDTGEDCIHGLNVGSDPRCSLCTVATDLND